MLAVAMAERQRATGAELLNAVVLGYDVGVRLVDAVRRGLPSTKNRPTFIPDFLYCRRRERLRHADPWRSTRFGTAMRWPSSTFQANGVCALFAGETGTSASRSATGNTRSPA